MKSIIDGISSFVRDEQGVTMVEYGLIAALIAIVCIVAITNVGTNLNVAFETICNALAGAVTGGTAC